MMRSYDDAIKFHSWIFFIDHILIVLLIKEIIKCEYSLEKKKNI